MPFTAGGETIQLPTYQDITGSSNIPPVTAGLPATVTIKLSRTNFDNVSLSQTTGTPELYSSLLLNSSSSEVTFNTNMIPVTINSPCSISSGHTYNLYAYAAGAQIEAMTGIVPNGDSVTTTLNIPSLYGDSFPSGVTVDIVATQS